MGELYNKRKDDKSKPDTSYLTLFKIVSPSPGLAAIASG
jgi:hypothetical protein